MRRNKTVDKTTASQVHGSDMASDEEGRVIRTKHADYQLVPLPKAQREIAAALRLTEHKHIIHVLTEVDEDKSVQAHRKGRNQLVLFQDVDVFMPVEREVEGQKVPLSLVVRAANHKTAREIHQEIRAFQKQPATQLVQEMPPWLARVFARWPGLIIRLLGWAGGRSALLWKRMVGTCGITAVGMVGKGVGWGIPSHSPYSLMLALGGITTKPGIVDGQIAIREYLCLTVCFDHDIIDGAPAARFVTRLKELIESGFGLLDQDIMAEQAST